ncbi:MAG: ABC transporter permease [Leptolinea sp.]|jgi:ABC-type lipoprotein release transport system permease subunit|nr:ABC transporter permease [Leptolinea sp.]
MRLYLRLAWRNIWRHRRRTLIVVISIGLSLAMMMMYDGLVVGFQDAIYANAVKVLGGNVQVHAAGYREKTSKNPIIPLNDDQRIVETAAKLPNVISASRRVVTGGMVANRKGSFSVSISGIEPELEQKISLIAANIKTGRNLTSADQDVVLVGKGLADAMEVAVGDRITLVGSGMHNQTVKRTMTVAGIYDLGLKEIEKKYVYLSIDEARYLFSLTDQSTEVIISLEKLGQEPDVIRQMKAAFPNTEVDSWENNYPEMGMALNRKNSVMNIFGTIILLIAGIGILNLLLMAVFERTREIGILGALGIKPRQIGLLFVLEGTMMGLVGLAAGALLGLGVNALLGQIGLDYSAYTSMTEYLALITGRVYPTLGLEYLWQHGVTVLVIAILSSLYPAREAALKEPAAALHTV